MTKEGYRLSGLVLFPMLAFALFLDILSFAPIFDIVTDSLGAFVFGLWYWNKGIPFSFKNPRRLFVGAATFFGEMFEIGLDWLPLWIGGVLLVWVMVRLEDKSGLSILTPLRTGKLGIAKQSLIKAGAKHPEHIKAIKEFPEKHPRATAGLRRIKQLQQRRYGLGGLE